VKLDAHEEAHVKAKPVKSAIELPTQMKNKTQLFISVAAILVFDVVASFASRLLHFDYGSLMWVTFCLYMFCGYLGFQYRQLLGGFLAGLVAGAADSTAGWALSAAIHPYMRYPQPRPTIFMVSVVIVFVTLVGGFFGFTGAVIAKGFSLMRADN
jgi:hypothetical protein